jgi:hypothetical protein
MSDNAEIAEILSDIRDEIRKQNDSIAYLLEKTREAEAAKQKVMDEIASLKGEQASEIESADESEPVPASGATTLVLPKINLVLGLVMMVFLVWLYYNDIY